MSIDNTAQKLAKDADVYDIDDEIHLYMEDLGDDGTGVKEVYWLTIPKQHLDAMAKLWLTAQDVLPKLKGCWSQTANDFHFDQEAFKLIRKLRQALEKE